MQIFPPPQSKVGWLVWEMVSLSLSLSLSKILSFAETGKELREEGSSSDFLRDWELGCLLN